MLRLDEVVGLAHQRHDGGANLDTDRVTFRRKDARVRQAVRRDLAGLVFVTVQAVDAYRVKRVQVALPHPRERQSVEPGIVGDEADPPTRLLGDAPFCHAEEPDIEVVQPLALRPADTPRRAVGIGQVPFLVHRHAGEAVVGRVAEDHEDRRLLLHLIRAVAFLFQFRERQRLRRSRLPPP